MRRWRRRRTTITVMRPRINRATTMPATTPATADDDDESSSLTPSSCPCFASSSPSPSPVGGEDAVVDVADVDESAAVDMVEGAEPVDSTATVVVVSPDSGSASDAVEAVSTVGTGVGFAVGAAVGSGVGTVVGLAVGLEVG